MVKRTLTEAEWSRVFQLRCKTKRGEVLTEPERTLIQTAFESDRKRYSAMEGDIFEATVPAGSTAKWRK